MATPAQIIANRSNAQLSTGPRSAAGKATVAANARRHGLSGTHFSLLPEEDPAEFEALLEALIAEHLPATHTEAFLVREMVHAEWKLRRIARLETDVLTGELGDTAVRFAADCSFENQLARLSRYEQTARNAWHRALNQLRQLRKDRARQNESNPIAQPQVPQPAATQPRCEAKPNVVHRPAAAAFHPPIEAKPIDLPDRHNTGAPAPLRS